MEIAVITLFPNIFEQFFSSSIIGRAQRSNLIKFKLVNLAGFAEKHQVDDKLYGGGTGMVIKPDVAVAAIEQTKKQLGKETKTILLTPTGRLFNQKMAEKIAKFSQLIIFCGHYQGVDERVAKFVNFQISIGDYILTGGEAAAMVIIEAVTRLRPNVLPKVEFEKESFSNSLLAAPVFTRPEIFRGLRVPKVLSTGNQKKIAAWRKHQQILKTKKIRPDLFKKYLKIVRRGQKDQPFQ